MKIEATAKEIADLVFALQGQRGREISVLIGEKEVGRCVTCRSGSLR